MATIGLRDLYVAKLTEDESGAPAYAAPKRLAKGITVDLAIETSEGTLYADDSVDETVKEFKSGALTLSVNDLSVETEAELLGKQTDADGVVYASGDDEPPYFAVGFRAKKAGGEYRYVWLYKVKFGVPNEKYSTKGDGIEFSTPEIVGTVIKREDGLWKTDFVGKPEDAAAKTWFTEVREKNNAKPQE